MAMLCVQLQQGVCLCVCQRGGSMADRGHHLPATDTFVPSRDPGPDLTLSQFIWPFPAHVLFKPRSELPLEDFTE